MHVFNFPKLRICHKKKQVIKNSGSNPRNACVACENIALESVTDGQTDGRTDRRRKKQSYVSLCFEAGDTKRFRNFQPHDNFLLNFWMVISPSFNPNFATSIYIFVHRMN